MKLLLEGCKHRAIEQYRSEDQDALHATCLGCYTRLRLMSPRPNIVALSWTPDYPARTCDHPDKRPVSVAITNKMPYRDAICDDCGVILRHPDGPGQWVEVLFNGYLIREEPSLQ